MISFTPKLKAEYESLWASCEIDYEPRIADSAAARLLKSKGRYQKVEALTGVPWYWIAIVHEREAGGSFSGVLHNGEKIIGTGRVTKLVPANRGPFSTWEEAAVDALTIKGLNKGVEWNVGRFWYECERFNGFGYRYKGVPSPYLWSHTNHYKDFSGDAGDPGGGKYTADHVYSPNVHDKQLGAAAVLIALMKLDSSIAFGRPSPQPPAQLVTQSAPASDQPTPEKSTVQGPSSTAPTGSSSATIASGVVSILGALLAYFLDHWYLLVVPAILLGVGYWLWRRSKLEELPKGSDPKPASVQSEPTKEPEQ